MEEEDREWIKDLFKELREDQRILARNILIITNEEDTKPQDLMPDLLNVYLIANREN